jgi:hypothetical protein
MILPGPEAERLAALDSELASSLAAVRARQARHRRRSNLFMAARLATFALIMAAAIALANDRDSRVARTAVLPAIAIFVLVVILHQPVLREIERLDLLESLIERQRARFDDRPLATDSRKRGPVRLPFDGRGSFALPEYVQDDIAVAQGKTSLFAWLDGASTPLGSTRLRQWLTHPCLDGAAIRARQAAAQALVAARAPRHRIEQELGARQGDDFAFMLAHLERYAPEAPPPRALPVGICVAGAWAMIAHAFASGSHAWLGGGVAWLVLVSFFYRADLKRAVTERHEALVFEPMLRASVRLRAKLETLPADPVLARIRGDLERLSRDGDLERFLRALRFAKVYRAGLVYVAFNAVTLYDLFVMGPIARFWTRRRADVLAAFGAVADLEALAAIAQTKECKAHTCWPVIEDGEAPHLEIGRGLHPLVALAAAVPNDLRLGPLPRLLVVTGSNMSGKSTYLKMAAQNVLLAQAGAPARARALALTPLRMLSDINVRDALDSGESFFAVEAGRVRAVLDLAAQERRSLFLLDEIFRGTNTREKVAAGVEVALHLARSGALAILATHDFEFTHLEREAADGSIENAHFADVVEGEMMVFDFTLKDGPTPGCNALRVLELKGFPKTVIQAARRRAQAEEA